MNIMFLDVTHQHSDKKWVPLSRSPKISSARGSRPGPRTPPKWQLSLRQPTPDPSFSLPLVHLEHYQSAFFNRDTANVMPNELCMKD